MGGIEWSSSSAEKKRIFKAKQLVFMDSLVEDVACRSSPVPHSKGGGHKERPARRPRFQYRWWPKQR